MKVIGIIHYFTDNSEVHGLWNEFLNGELNTLSGEDIEILVLGESIRIRNEHFVGKHIVVRDHNITADKYDWFGVHFLGSFSGTLSEDSDTIRWSTDA